MKKYKMLIITVIMIILTTIVYLYDHYSREIPQAILPTFNINSPKYGEIKEIVWVNNHISAQNTLLVLSSKTVQETKYSYLYSLNIDTEKSDLLGVFPSHKNLDDVLLFDINHRYVVAAYREGIVRSSASFESNAAFKFLEAEELPIEDFEDATSIDVSRSLAYTLSKDSLLYIKNIPASSLYHNNVFNEKITNLFGNPHRIVNLNWLDQTVLYTGLRRNGINLYGISYNGVPVDHTRPLLKNIVNTREIDNTVGIVGFQISDDPASLNAFMVSRTPQHEASSQILDTIPYNTDPYGAVPSIDSTTMNEDYTVVYTSYNQNHNGIIKIVSNKETPREVLKTQGLFGPVRITEKSIGDERTKLILYLTSDGNEPKVKICDLEGNLYKDITELIIGK